MSESLCEAYKVAYTLNKKRSHILVFKGFSIMSHRANQKGFSVGYIKKGFRKPSLKGFLESELN